MRNLKKLLLNSTSARMLSVRRFAQDNRGEKTTGIDGKANLNQKRRADFSKLFRYKRIRRVSIERVGHQCECFHTRQEPAESVVTLLALNGKEVVSSCGRLFAHRVPGEKYKNLRYTGLG